MDVRFILSIYLCTISVFPVGSGSIFNVLKISWTVLKEAQFGMSVIEMLIKLRSDEPPSDLSHIKDEINENIKALKTEIITTITLQSKLDRIEDAVINIHSSLIDLKYILQATTEKDRDEYIRLFVTRFEDHGLIKHLRFLPQLLEYNIPGTTGKLVDLFAEQSRCNMTAIYAFRTFYYSLISNGIALELSYLKLSTEVPLNETLGQWETLLVPIGHIFETQETTCKSKFSKYAKEDVQNANDARKLWTENKQRYPWKISDVIVWKPFGTYQFLFIIHRETVFWDRSGKSKIAIFSDQNQTKPDVEILQNAEEKLRNSIRDEWDENAAKNVGNAFKDFVKDKGYIITSLLVYFDGEEDSSERIILDENSPVLQLSIRDVKMRNCFDKICGHKTKWKSVYGDMKVFAYIVNLNSTTEIHQEPLQTGSNSQNEPFMPLIYIFLILCIEVFGTKQFVHTF